MKWNDVTSYQRGDKLRIPRVWELRGDLLRLVVHRLHGCEPTTWFLTCHDMGVRDRALESLGIPEAQAEALSFVLERLKKILAELQGAE